MPASPGESGRERWEEQLADAFGILLGRPLEDFDSTPAYALYHWDRYMSEGFCGYFGDIPLGSVVPPLRGDGSEYPLDWGRWGIDLGRSIFEFRDDHAALEQPVGAALRTVSRDASRVCVTGADLAPVSAGHDGLFNDFDDIWLTVMARADTDGTLFGAMRAATWTMGGPADLRTPDCSEAVVEPEWQATLERIPDPVLRSHIQLLGQKGRCACCAGVYYSGTEYCPDALEWLASQPGYAFVPGWELGEFEGSSAIFAIS